MSDVVVILGHPSLGSFNEALAESYADGARAAGAKVTVLRLAAMDFDPVLQRPDQPLEPDLVRAQRCIDQAQHVVWVTPLWWGGLPALLKGFIDRTFQPGWAYRYEKGKTFQDPLLTGRSARVLLTMDAPTWWYRLRYGAPVHGSLLGATLRFSGFSPVRATTIGRVRELDDAARGRWLERVRRRGEVDARGLGGSVWPRGSRRRAS